jgi:hypothetical protein
MPRRTTRLLLGIGLLALSLVGCEDQAGDYVAVSSISENGFAKHNKAMLALNGRKLSLWGYVDHGNLFPIDHTRQGPAARPEHDQPAKPRWRFNLKGRPDDPTGHSFAVRVIIDSGRNALIRTFLEDARRGRPTKVFVTGTLVTFHAPTAGRLLVGLSMNVESSQDILLDAKP